MSSKLTYAWIKFVFLVFVVIVGSSDRLIFYHSCKKTLLAIFNIKIEYAIYIFT